MTDGTVFESPRPPGLDGRRSQAEDGCRVAKLNRRFCALSTLKM